MFLQKYRAFFKSCSSIRGDKLHWTVKTTLHKYSVTVIERVMYRFIDFCCCLQYNNIIPRKQVVVDILPLRQKKNIPIKSVCKRKYKPFPKLQISDSLEVQNSKCLQTTILNLMKMAESFPNG